MKNCGGLRSINVKDSTKSAINNGLEKTPYDPFSLLRGFMNLFRMPEESHNGHYYKVTFTDQMKRWLCWAIIDKKKETRKMLYNKSFETDEELI